MKKDQYFNLEVNFLSDDNIVRMMMQLDAAQSLGIYMMLLTHLRKTDNYEASCCTLCMESFARMYALDADMLQRVLREFDLFVLDEERQMFRSPYLDRVMQALEKRRMIQVENGRKGGRPRKEEPSETPMDKGEKPNQNQKSREEERRVTTVVKDNNSSNEEKKEKENSAAAVSGEISGSCVGKQPVDTVPGKTDGAVGEGDIAAEQPDVAAKRPTASPKQPTASPKRPDVSPKQPDVFPKQPGVSPKQLCIVPPPENRGQLPLQPVLSWEVLVDQMAESKSYMESMAMHSCMGKLFVERQEEVIAAFKEHIRRFGREDGLLFLRDVKLYFGNYLSPGGRPAQELKKRLLNSCRPSAEEEQYRFEQFIDGRRTYLGHPIPADAPPRPDRSAVWDELRCKWGN